MKFRRGCCLVVLLLASCVPTQITTTPTPLVDTSAPIPSAGLDVEMEAALAQAHATLNEFIGRISTPHPNRTYVALKVHFAPLGDFASDIWVEEITYTVGLFRGLIGDDVPALKLQAGDEIEVVEKDIVDWMIVEDGVLIGGFTIRLAYQRMTPEEREQFLETIDYSLGE